MAKYNINLQRGVEVETDDFETAIRLAKLKQADDDEYFFIGGYEIPDDNE